MPLLHIQHSVPNFDAWKKAFDSDPMDRSGSGVLRYHIHQSVSDPNFVMIDLEFDRVSEAEQMLERLQRLWAGAGPAVMRRATAAEQFRGLRANDRGPWASQERWPWSRPF